MSSQPLDLSIENEGVKQVNYLAVTKFFQLVYEHIKNNDLNNFQGIIVYGHCNSNKFGNYNVDLGPIIWLMFANGQGELFPRPIPLQGRVVIQVSKAFCTETPKPNVLVEIQIYNQDMIYNAETTYKRYVCTTNLSQFVKTYISQSKQVSYQPPMKLFTDENIKI